MPSEHRMVHTVRFADTDAAGMAHFTAFFRFMEDTEHAFYESLGVISFRRNAEGDYGVPRVAASCDFRRPVRYGDSVEVHLIVREKSTRKIGYEFVFRPARGGEELARGRMTVVHAFRPAGDMRFSGAVLPDALLDGIEVAEDA